MIYSLPERRTLMHGTTSSWIRLWSCLGSPPASSRRPVPGKLLPREAEIQQPPGIKTSVPIREALGQEIPAVALRWSSALTSFLIPMSYRISPLKYAAGHPEGIADQLVHRELFS